MMTREIFETTFKIHDHDTVDPNDPFPLVTMKPKRARNWAAKEVTQKLIALDVPNKTGMSIQELLYETSTGDFENILEACEESSRRDSKLAEEIRQETQDALNNALGTVKNK